MKRINYIVHPEYVIASPDMGSVREYVETIENIAKDSECFLVLAKATPLPQNSFQKEISNRMSWRNLANSERTLFSNELYFEGSYYPFGHVEKDSWVKLTESLRGVDEVRIHGCFFGDACVQSLAVQIYGYLAKKEHWFNWVESQSTGTVIKERLRTDLLELFGTFGNFNKIRYGAVYSNKQVGKRKLINPIPRCLYRRTLDEQLTDSHTRIFG